MGITEPTTPGKLFPSCDSPVERDVLPENFWDKGDHPSFGLKHGEEEEPPTKAIRVAVSAASFVASAVEAIGGGIDDGVANAKRKAKSLAGGGVRKRPAADALQPFRGQVGKSSCLARETQDKEPVVLKEGRERSPKDDLASSNPQDVKNTPHTP